MHLEQSVESQTPELGVMSDLQRLKRDVQWKVMEKLEFLKLPINENENPMTEEEIKMAYEHWVSFGFADRFEDLFADLYFGIDGKESVKDGVTLVETITVNLKSAPAVSLVW